MINSISNQYSIFEKIRLAIWLIRTKIISRNARMIRFPFHLRGKKYVKFGHGFTTGYGCRIEAYKCDKLDNSIKISFGDNVQINDYVHVSSISHVDIGNDVLIASHVYISDNSHGSYKNDINDTSPEIPPKNRPYYVSPVKIGDRVWIGEGVIILPGVKIGDGCIIGAHSIVNRDIPANGIAVGSPIKIIKKYSFSSKRWEKL